MASLPTPTNLLSPSPPDSLAATTRPAERTVDHGQRRQFVTESLLSEIFQGRLRAGQHLVIQELSTRFEVSSTPVREALVALAGIGILDLAPNRGAVVRKMTTTDVKEICQVRRALECEATRAACGRVPIAQLQPLAAAFRRMLTMKRHSAAAVARAITLDSQLHDLVADHCGNRFLAAELGRLKLLFRAFRDAAWEYDRQHNDHHRSAEEAGEHLAIVEGLLAGDRRRASLAMAHHIRSGVKYWSRGLPR